MVQLANFNDFNLLQMWTTTGDRIDLRLAGLPVSIGGTDTRFDMLEAVSEWAFPALHKVISEALDEPATRRDLIKALRRDVVELLKYTWRAAHIDKRTDFEGALLRNLGLTKAPPWFRRLMDRQKADE